MSDTKNITQVDLVGSKAAVTVSYNEKDESGNIKARTFSDIQLPEKAELLPSDAKTRATAAASNAINNLPNVYEADVNREINKAFNYELNKVSDQSLVDEIKSNTVGASNKPALKTVKDTLQPNDNSKYDTLTQLSTNTGVSRNKDNISRQPTQINNTKTTEKKSTYQRVLSGADISVFLMAEMPIIEPNDPNLSDNQNELLLIELDSVLSLSYSIMRETFPVRALGQSKVMSYTRGPSTVSGHIAFTVFTEDALMRIRYSLLDKVTALQGHMENIQKEIQKAKEDESKTKKKITTSTTYNPNAEKLNTEFDNLIKRYNKYETLLKSGGVYLLNQLLPFHIYVLGYTENGINGSSDYSRMLIKNVRVIDENQFHGVSQPNIMNKVTFVAEDIIPLSSFKGNAINADTTNPTDVPQKPLGEATLPNETGKNAMQEAVNNAGKWLNSFGTDQNLMNGMDQGGSLID